MVIPIGGMGMPIMGPPPEEVQGSLKMLRHATVVLMCFCGGRLMFSFMVPGLLSYDISATLNIIINILFGIFLFKDDPCMSGVYQRLATTCCQPCDEQCQGGMACLMPYGISCCIFAVLDLFQNFSMVNAILSQTPSMALVGYAFCVLGSVIDEFIIAYLCYRIYKRLRALTEGGGLMMGGPQGGGGMGGGAPYNANAPSAPPQELQAREARPAPGFVPFSGGGQRLGS